MSGRLITVRSSSVVSPVTKNLAFRTFVALLLLPASTSLAGISTTGNVNPSDTSTWTGLTSGCVGNTDDGSLTINGGSDLKSYYGFLGYENGVTGEVIITDDGSTWTNDYGIYVGYYGKGTLNIIGGGAVYSYIGVIGDYSGSQGTVTVDGDGSMWTNSSYFSVGYYATGTLSITNGGMVSSNADSSHIGNCSGSRGTVTVDGKSSTWTNKRSLYVGNEGRGMLNITGGGAVTAGRDVLINNQSRLSIIVSNDNMLAVDSDFTNDGTVRITAGPELVAGTYTPISVVGDWSAGGAYEAFGGAWDASAHTFAVGAMTETDVNGEATIHLDTDQRIKVGNSLVASFMPTEESTQLDFTATATSDDALASLFALLGEDESLQGSWDFSVSGLPSGNDVMLSFAVTGSPTADGCQIWHYDGTWTSYSTDDLLVSGGWASFTVDSFSSYAVTTTAVPEPQVLALLLSAGLICLLRRRSI